MWSYSKFPRSANLITPAEEILSGRACMEEVWKAIKNRAPDAKCYQLRGNHDLRPSKRLTEKYPEIASLVDLSHLWSFDGVTTLYDDREPLIIENINFIHGYKTQLGSHAKSFISTVVCGHSHRGGVMVIPTLHNGIIYELNCGYLADPEHEALKYTPNKFTAWTHGLGWIDEFGPRFICL